MVRSRISVKRNRVPRTGYSDQCLHLVTRKAGSLALVHFHSHRRKVVGHIPELKLKRSQSVNRIQLSTSSSLSDLLTLKNSSLLLLFYIFFKNLFAFPQTVSVEVNLNRTGGDGNPDRFTERSLPLYRRAADKSGYLSENDNRLSFSSVYLFSFFFQKVEFLLI